MSDTIDVNPENPDSAPEALPPAAPEVPEAAAEVAQPKPDFGSTTLHSDLLAHIEAEGGYAIGRLHQILAEMRELFNL